MLQRQRRLPLLVDLMDALQTLPEAPGEHREQRALLRGEGPPITELEVHDQHTLRVLQRDARGTGHAGVGHQQLAVTQRRDRCPGARGQLAPVSRTRSDADQLRDRTVLMGREDGGLHGVRVPHLAERLDGPEHGVVEGVGLHEALVERSQCGLPLHHVPLGGDVAHGSDSDSAARVRIGGVLEGRAHPQAMAVAVGDRDCRHGAVRALQQLLECHGGLPVFIGVAVAGQPPRVGRLVRQTDRCRSRGCR